MIRNFFRILVGLIFCSCSGIASSDFPFKGQKDLIYHQIRITDSITINASSMSLDGSWGIYGDRLYYVDKHQVPIKYFDTLGHFLGRQLEQGRGPNELVSAPVFFGYTPEDEMIFIDGNWVFYRFDKHSHELYRHRYLDDIIFNQSDWDILLKNPDVDNPMMYELDFSHRTFTLFKDWVIIPVTTEHVSYNGFDKKARAKDFYKHSYTLGAFNRRTFFQEHFFGHFPPAYRQKMIPNFMSRCVAADKDYLYVAYEAIPLIYAYDSNLAPAFAFGYGGQGMKINYPETSSAEEALEAYKGQRQKYDFYNALQYIHPYLFRSYTSGGTVHLQVYEDSNLLGDIDTGRNEFQLMGYIAPWYYACVTCDIDNEVYVIVKIQLN